MRCVDAILLAELLRGPGTTFDVWSRMRARSQLNLNILGSGGNDDVRILLAFTRLRDKGLVLAHHRPGLSTFYSLSEDGTKEAERARAGLLELLGPPTPPTSSLRS